MQVSRRWLLKRAAVTAAIAPVVLPSHVWAADAKPNSRLAMGFVGMGTQNRGLLGGFLGQATQVLAVCDVDTTRRTAAQTRVDGFYGKRAGQNAGCAAYNDFRQIIDRKDIDAVSIATPDHWHAVVTLAALRAGKDVYCEKPLTHNIHEAVEVLRAVDANKRVLQTGSMQRSSKEFRVACELVLNGAIGKLLRAECQFGGPGVPCNLPEEEMEPGLDWNQWVGPAPMRPYNSVLSPRGVHTHFPDWRAYREFGGGDGHGLGGAPPGHRAVGAGHGRERAGGGVAAGEAGGEARREAGVCQRRDGGAHRRIRRGLLRHGGGSPGQPRQIHLQTRQRDDRFVHRQQTRTRRPPAPRKCRRRSGRT